MMIKTYLDCGCAIDEEGKRHWCPTCQNGGILQQIKEKMPMKCPETDLKIYCHEKQCSLDCPIYSKQTGYLAMAINEGK